MYRAGLPEIPTLNPGGIISYRVIIVDHEDPIAEDLSDFEMNKRHRT